MATILDRARRHRGYSSPDGCGRLVSPPAIEARAFEQKTKWRDWRRSAEPDLSSLGEGEACPGDKIGKTLHQVPPPKRSGSLTEIHHSGGVIMPRLTAAEVKEALLERIEELAPYLFPHGRRAGTHWCIGDITGAPGDSFKICIVGATPDYGAILHPGKNIPAACSTYGCTRGRSTLRRHWQRRKLGWGNPFLQPVRTPHHAPPQARQRPSLP